MISVIIPAYNSANTIGQQLDAIAAQQYEGKWEVIVSDNGSSDGTGRVVKEFQKTMPHLHLVSAYEKQGPAYARNVGAKAARGTAFIFCDADDQVMPGWLAAMANAVDKHNLVVGALEVKTLNPTNPSKSRFGNNGMNDRLLNFWPYAITANCAISRKAFETAGGFSEEFQKDMDVELSWRLRLLGFPVHEAP